MLHLKNLLIYSLITPTIFAAEYSVSSADDFNSLSLSPGDSVIWQDGTYSSDDNIQFSANGTASNPITLKAETSGGVIFTGEMTVDISGDYLSMEGFYWNGGASANNHVEFRQGENYANYSTLRNCSFNNLTPSGTDKHRWVVFYGTNNTVENCSFMNKRSPGALLLVELEYSGYDALNHTIKNNYFYNYEFREIGTTHAGDSETIRVGTSSYQDKSASVLVESNYFKETDGESEIVSNKSKDNTYKYNTFRNCYGGLVLRHGADAWVEGNYFLGEQKEGSGGIRITDTNHTVINNYFQELRNDGNAWNNSITLVGGSDTSGGTTNGYQKVDNVLVAFNTIYDCDAPLFYNDKSSHDPTGIFAYNLVYSTRTDVVSGDISGTGQGMSYIGNIAGGATIGISDSGFTSANANFSQSGEIFKPSSSGVASGAAGSAYSSIATLDIEGLTRPSSNRDVGAHEISGGSGSSTNEPHVDGDVGFTVGASFLDHEGNTIEGSVPDYLSASELAVLPYTAGKSSIAVSSNLDWTASDNANWISLSPTSGSNNGSIEVTVTQNSTTSTRTGRVTITSGDFSEVITVTQQPFTEVSDIELSPSAITILEGAQTSLSTSFSPSDASDKSVTFTSSASAIATVNSSGVVTGIYEGTAIITVTSADGGFTDTTVVTVVDSPSVNNLALYKPVTGTGTADDDNIPFNITDGEPDTRWSVSGYPQTAVIDLGSVYSIDGTGVITYNDRSYQYTISVATDVNGPFTEVVNRSENTTIGTADDPITDAVSNVSGRYVQITITGAGNYTGSWISLTEVMVYGDAVHPYYTWMAGFTDVDDNATDGDPDNDGQSSIIEYVLGGDPESYDKPMAPTYNKIGGKYVISIDRRASSTIGMTQIFQYSEDLITWFDVDISDMSEDNVELEASSGEMETISITPDANVADAAKLFWRLQLTPSF